MPTKPVLGVMERELNFPESGYRGNKQTVEISTPKHFWGPRETTQFESLQRHVRHETLQMLARRC
jgi:hypothetical protein